MTDTTMPPRRLGLLALGATLLAACASSPDTHDARRSSETETLAKAAKVVHQQLDFTHRNARVYGTFGESGTVIGPQGALIDPLSGVVRKRLPGSSIALGPDGRHACMRKSEQDIGVYDTVAERWLWTQPIENAGRALVSKDACAFPVSDEWRRLRRWRVFDLKSGEARPALEPSRPARYPGSAASFRYSPDGRWLVVSAPPAEASASEHPDVRSFRPWLHRIIDLEDFSVVRTERARCLTWTTKGATACAETVGYEPYRRYVAPLPDGKHVLIEQRTQLVTLPDDGSQDLERRYVSREIATVERGSGARKALLDPVARKGISIAQSHGMPVVASADGHVLYWHNDAGVFRWRWKRGERPEQLSDAPMTFRYYWQYMRLLGPELSPQGNYLGFIDPSSRLHRIRLSDDTALPVVALPTTAPGNSTPIWRYAIDDDGSVAVLVDDKENNKNTRGLFVAGPDEDKLTRVSKWKMIADMPAEMQWVRRDDERRLVVLDGKYGLYVFDPDGWTFAHYAPRKPTYSVYEALAVAPNSTAVSFASTGTGSDDKDSGRGIWVTDLFDLEGAERLDYPENWRNYRPRWSPTGERRSLFYDPQSDSHVLRDDTSDAAATRVLSEIVGSLPLVRTPQSELFLVQRHGEPALSLLDRDGHTRLTFGLVADGPYAYTPEGSYFCEGRGCEMFRCMLGDAKAVEPNQCHAVVTDDFTAVLPRPAHSPYK
ncbi:hypothetical protein FIV42_06885 [Persicimonas caeni]|uniref:WD40 repeat domain-containing protein n=1 Tax=Persicimonas caeni TaxID=2292766 RepID=A0A4Y6PR28_PERCE|nr:hypothetical protein [Persicimonas caeni]QDG50467.1 hypothetical protein FIV42_06885 [Persicimonas caeni]QED31688.1 hypothetical protein FRD00_06880 [Persicimonas caeni]